MAEKKKKKTAQGFTAKDYTPGLRKKGESFMDFTTRQHEQRYPGAQRMAREAGAGGWRAFTPAGAEYRRGIREEMPWLKPDQKYMSEDWKRMLANRQTDMYGGGAQVGGAPPGRPPLPTAMGNVLGGAPRRPPYRAGMDQVLGAGPPRPIRNTGGDASVAEAMYSSPRGIGQRYDFPPVGAARPQQIGPTWPGANQMGGAPRPPTRVQVPMGTGRAPVRWPNTPPPGLGTQQLSMADLARMQQQAGASRPATPYPGQNYGQTGANLGQFPRYPASPAGSRQPYNILGGGPAGTRPMSYPGQNYGQTGAFLGQFPRYPASPAGSQLPYNVLGQPRGRLRVGGERMGEIPGTLRWPNYYGPPQRPRIAGEQYPRRRQPPWT